MNGVILLPTLNRTKLLRTFIESYVETKASIDVLILVDDDDYELNQVEYDDIVKLLPDQMEIISTGNSVSMAEKTKYVWPAIKDDYQWVGLLNDDHYCITPEWDQKVEALIDGTNMVSTNDGFWNFGLRVVGVTAWSMPLLKAVGFPIFPDGIQHLYIDDVWKAIGDSTGCWFETMTVNIEHRHTFIGKMEQDATFKKVNNPKTYQDDLVIFQKFMEQEFKGVCENVLKLRSSQLLSSKFS